ncbi:response regulator [candidate division WWE3 bacterium]|uniref:Response regulator n=1 Tax=candidate division WWE3 bacterium TaxID=2053526 RepID=A0A955LWL1_UNCKA|nr:response regulator [candidate division WWE3 bacterium]
MANERILVVEDERPMANILGMKLKSQGFGVDIVFNGDEALHAISDTDYDLILLDLVMPKIDGFSFLEKIKSLHLNIPIVVITNLSQEMDRKRALDLGATKYLIKTEVNLTDIINTAKSILTTT